MSLKTLIKSLDNLTNSNKTIDNDHNYIHLGKLFTYCENFDLATTATKIFTFTTPSTLYDIHYRPAIVSTSADKLKIEVIEEATISASGTNKLNSIFNSNRQSSKTTNMQTFASGSSITGGTVILIDYIGGGTGVGQSRSGSAVGQANEIVAKQNKVYAIRFTNGSSGTNTVNVKIQWYEEDSYTFNGG